MAFVLYRFEKWIRLVVQVKYKLRCIGPGSYPGRLITRLAWELSIASYRGLRNFGGRVQNLKWPDRKLDLVTIVLQEGS
jgi:hypothetical protein